MRFGKGSSKSKENSELSSSSFAGDLGDVGATVGGAIVDGAAFEDATVDGIGVVALTTAAEGIGMSMPFVGGIDIIMLFCMANICIFAIALIDCCMFCMICMCIACMVSIGLAVGSPGGA